MTWVETITELQSLGLTQPQIAVLCGCGQSTISDLATCKTTDPRHSLGQALRDLLISRRAQALMQAGEPTPEQPATAVKEAACP